MLTQLAFVTLNSKLHTNDINGRFALSSSYAPKPIARKIGVKLKSMWRFSESRKSDRSPILNNLYLAITRTQFKRDPKDYHVGVLSRCLALFAFSWKLLPVGKCKSHFPKITEEVLEFFRSSNHTIQSQPPTDQKRYLLLWMKRTYHENFFLFNFGNLSNILRGTP